MFWPSTVTSEISRTSFIKISLNLAASAFATFAKVSKPAFTKASAALGPAPSIFFKSSALEDFFGAALASAFGASL